MKIAQISYTYPPVIGGVEKVIEKTSKYFVRGGHEVHVFTSDFDGLHSGKRINAPAYEVTKDGVHVHRLKSYMPPISPYIFKPIFPGLFRELMKYDFDVVNIHSYPSFHLSVAWAYCKAKNIPLFATGQYSISDLDFIFKSKDLKNMVRRLYWRIKMKRIFRYKKARIICTVPSEKAGLEKYLGKLPIVLLTNGMDDEDFKIGKRPRGYERNLLYLARISRQKGLDVLVKAAKILKDNGVKFKLTVVGPIGDKEFYEKEVKQYIFKNGLQKNIDLIGPVTGSRVQKEYANAGTYILPSRGEIFGITIVQAMYCGDVAVGSRIGGIPDVIDDKKTGFLFESENPKDLAKKLEFILENYNGQAVKKVREAGRKKAVAKYLWKNISKQILKEYEKARKG